MGKGQTLQSWSDTIDTDLVGVFNVIQASMPHLNDGASVIATGSLAAQLGSASNQGPGGSAYSLAKQMVAHYVNDLSIQLANRMIRVNALHPTNVNTDMLQNEGMYREFRPDMASPTRDDAEAGRSRRCRRCRSRTSSRTTCRPPWCSWPVTTARFITGTQLRVDAGGYVKMRALEGLKRHQPTTSKVTGNDVGDRNGWPWMCGSSSVSSVMFVSRSRRRLHGDAGLHARQVQSHAGVLAGGERDVRDRACGRCRIPRTFPTVVRRGSPSRCRRRSSNRPESRLLPARCPRSRIAAPWSAVSRSADPPRSPGAIKSRSA